MATVLGEDRIDRDVEPSLGAEDFAYMLEEKPGAYIWLGSGPAPAEPEVDVDEGTRGREGERGEEGEAGNANPDGKKTRGGADASAETAAREL